MAIKWRRLCDQQKYVVKYFTIFYCTPFHWAACGRGYL